MSNSTLFRLKTEPFVTPRHRAAMNDRGAGAVARVRTDNVHSLGENSFRSIETNAIYAIGTSALNRLYLKPDQAPRQTRQKVRSSFNNRHSSGHRGRQLCAKSCREQVQQIGAIDQFVGQHEELFRNRQAESFGPGLLPQHNVHLIDRM